MAEMTNLLSRLEKIFKAVKLKYVIVGGIAVIHYGYVRGTQDVDIIIEDDSTKFKQLIGLLKSYDFNVLEDQFYMGYHEKTQISIFDNKSYFRLDMKIASSRNEKDVLNNAKIAKILGSDMFIAPIEYILIGKILYMGKIDDIPDSELLEYQDILDFLTIYNANKENINMSVIHKKVQEIGLLSTLKRLVSLKI
jgi:hypothetical protein